MLGVAALIIVMSVMNGFRAELFDKIVGLNGHAIVQGYDGRLADWRQIADAARKHGKSAGYMAASAELGREYLGHGYRMIASGTDPRSTTHERRPP